MRGLLKSVELRCQHRHRQPFTPGEARAGNTARMSGPLGAEDVMPDSSEPRPLTPTPTLEITPSHEARVGAITVRRALPHRARRTVGAWCFIDHMGPAPVTEHEGINIGPHPHIGLQTVTWLEAGEVLHRDSLGSEVVIRPGQLNLMTAGRGVAHSEEATGRYRGDLHGLQLWIAQPEATRQQAAAFEHHDDLPQVELAHGEATVLVGEFAGAASPARRDTDHFGAVLGLRRGTTSVPLRSDSEHALVALNGSIAVDGTELVANQLCYLGPGRNQLDLIATDPTRLLLIGGVPFESPVLMWWNFVARTRSEIEAACDQWQSADSRFGEVRSPLARIPAPGLPWNM
jgi:redox-sensitive bicupin YhaK (pirin superfamily)